MSKVTHQNTYRDLADFLDKHSVKKGDDKPITNTRIADKTQNIYGGSYHIPDEDYPTFLNLYNSEVVAGKKKEYLTEKQLENDGPLLVDVDFRHAYDVDERLYTKQHIEDLIDLYLAELKQMYQFDDDTNIPVYVFQKPTVNRLKDKDVTKDGIHLMFGIKVDRAVQVILRTRVLKKVPEIWAGLPIKNSWEDVFDKGISSGFTNWQLYGSRKPSNDKYVLTHVFKYKFDDTDGEFMSDEVSLSAFDVGKNIEKLSVRYKNNPSYFMTSSFLTECEDFKRGTKSGVSSSSSSGNLVGTGGGGGTGSNLIQYDLSALSKIKNQEELDAHLEQFLNSLTLNDYELRDAYAYSMILPASYYDDGSYLKWIRLCWVLRNTSARLLVVFLKVSSKAKNFKYSSIPDICGTWYKTDIKANNGLTRRSLMNWAKMEAKEEYDKVQSNSIDHFVEETIKNQSINDKCGDYDLANVLYQINKERFVCVSIKANIWYQFKNHRWQECDSGTDLRKSISNEMRGLYDKKAAQFRQQMALQSSNALDEDGGDGAGAGAGGSDKDREIMKKRGLAANTLSLRMSQTNDKKNIMVESKELFYDATFLQKLDINPYLLCFNNGVFDFKEKVFRNGHPEDCISMCTNIDYANITPSIHQPIMDEFNDFMDKLFPRKELCEYMWDYLASCMLGTTVNQTFNIFIGVGQNGKSVLVNLMETVLGDYKGDVPLTLVTEKRGVVGGLAPEIVQLKGVRFAVMQEPSKDDKINEGIMKQFTSGKDPIQGRAPYMPKTISFIPQFKLVVTANNLMKIGSNDHGTWRRIRPVPFESLFTENPVKDDPDKPFQFLIDKTIDEKFVLWKEVVAAMLIARACITNGYVKDCDIVLDRCKEYRKSQDHYTEFIQERIEKDPRGRIKKSEINSEFTIWYTSNNGGKAPSPKDLHEQMNKEFGRQKNGAWVGVKIKYDCNNNDFGDTTTVDDDEDVYAGVV